MCSKPKYVSNITIEYLQFSALVPPSDQVTAITTRSRAMKRNILVLLTAHYVVTRCLSHPQINRTQRKSYTTKPVNIKNGDHGSVSMRRCSGQKGDETVKPIESARPLVESTDVYKKVIYNIKDSVHSTLLYRSVVESERPMVDSVSARAIESVRFIFSPLKF